MSSEVDIDQLQATIDAAIEQGRELMEERKNLVSSQECDFESELSR